MRSIVRLLTIIGVAAAGLWAAHRHVGAAVDLPNPYRLVDGWAKLPAGRTPGAASGVDVDPDGTSIWVLDRCGANSCVGSMLPPILKFDASGTLVKSFGAGRFVFPHGLHVDRSGNVWVTDGDGEKGRGHQVFKFSPDGTLLLTLGKAGVAGDGPDTFNRPADVAVARNGDIFVSDGHLPMTTNMRIVKFSKDGTFIKSWGHKGTAPGELDDPHSLAFDSRDRLFVADRGNNRIQIFDRDGKLLDEWKQFGSPAGLYISPDDTLYVAQLDAGIRIGSARDGSLKAFIRPPSSGVAVRVAESVAADARGNVYGGENANRKVTKYVPAAGAHGVHPVH